MKVQKEMLRRCLIRYFQVTRPEAANLWMFSTKCQIQRRERKVRWKEDLRLKLKENNKLPWLSKLDEEKRGCTRVCRFRFVLVETISAWRWKPRRVRLSRTTPQELLNHQFFQGPSSRWIRKKAQRVGCQKAVAFYACRVETLFWKVYKRLSPCEDKSNEVNAV